MYHCAPVVMTKKTYTIKEKLWVYPGDMANWHFVTVTKSVGGGYQRAIQQECSGIRFIAS